MCKNGQESDEDFGSSTKNDWSAIKGFFTGEVLDDLQRGE
jgi:hypothetical protein